MAFSLAVCTTLNAQTDIKISKKDFRKDKTGFEAAWKHVTNGNTFFSERGKWFNNAFDEYQKAQIYNSSCAGLNYKTGASALYSDNKEKAASYLLKALEEDPGITEDVLLLTGRALQFTGDYKGASEKLNEYINAAGRKPEKNLAEAKKYLEECTAALTVIQDTLRLDIENLGPDINSSDDEYSEVFTPDGNTIFYASRRESGKKSTSFEDGHFDENIYFSVQSDGKWETAMPAGKNLITKYCETPLYIDSSENTLFLYTGYENGGDIKMSVKKKGEWKAPQQVPFNINTNGSETSFTFTPDGSEAWYVTDHRKDGLGGKDIYYIKKVNDRKWSKPVNAGPSINSPYDEESLRFSGSGDTLWFSSRGHNSIGGYDIFYSVRDTSGKWRDAVNYGYPLNTSWDELFYFPAPGDDSLFYFASNRNETMGGLDIFRGRILPPEPVFVPPPVSAPDTVVIRDTVTVIKEIVQQREEKPAEEVFYLIGKISDSETGDPVLAKLDVVDVASDKVVATTASSEVDGRYRVRLPSRKSYMIDLRATGYLADMKRLTIPEDSKEEFFNLDATLAKVKVGKKVVLNNILFETGKSVLTAGSYAELGRLLNIMQDNPNMKIEVSGHTDKTGSEAVNFRLSEARAKAVVDFLIKQGINSDRMEYRGYGSLQPIADNTTPEGRQQNRRVEFKILEF